MADSVTRRTTRDLVGGQFDDRRNLLQHMNCVILLLVAFLGLAEATTCPHGVNARIQECVQPVAEYAKVLNNQDSKGDGSSASFGNAFAIPNMGGRMFNELCRLIARFNECVKEYRKTCDRHVTIALIDSSYGYLCNEGYNTFMESAECLMELDRKPTVKRCHDATLIEIESANTETGIAMAAKVDRMCGALNFFSGCVRSPIKQECGFSAWQVIYRVLKDTTNTLMPACQFTGTSHKLAQFQHESDGRPMGDGSDEPTIKEVVPESAVVVTLPPTTSPTPSKTTNRAHLQTTTTRKPMRKNINAAELSAPTNGSSRAISILILVLGYLCL